MNYLFKNVLLLIPCAGIFALVFYLTDVPVSSAGYAALLCLALISVVFIFNVIKIRRKNRQLEFIRSSLPDNYPVFPSSKSTIEMQYQDIILDLKKSYDGVVQASITQNQDMSDYYTMWAHQIKTPIAAMHLLLQSGKCDTHELECELFRIEEYVAMVLGYQRLNGESDLVLRRQSLDGIIRQSIRKYARQFIRKKLAVEYSGTELQVLTDEKWLCFVLEQLLSNALKYTLSGKITINVHDECYLTISDTGIGIKPEDLPRIFQRGFTGYNGRADKKSTGIGLYMCKKVCTMLGHEISISSCVGKGTNVTIRFFEE